MTDERRPGPVRYRIRAYDDNYEVQPDSTHLAVLDLDTPAGLRAAQVELEALRLALAAISDLDQRLLPKFRLTVHNWPDGTYVMDWIGR
jgi:hypothetical protein